MRERGSEGEREIKAFMLTWETNTHIHIEKERKKEEKLKPS